MAPDGMRAQVRLESCAYSTNNEPMLWGELGAGRRGVLLGLAGALALLIALLSFTALSTRSPAATTPLAPPLHPIAGTFVPDDTKLVQCRDEECFQQAFGNIAFLDGTRAAFANLVAVYGSGWTEGCHRATHAIGSASLARNRGDIARTLADGKPDCGSGFYHGVLERSLVQVRSRKPVALAGVARTLCAALPDVTPWIEYQCLHGLGHGLMIATGLNLPISLAVCGRLIRWWDRDACRSGVFMENLSTSYGARSIFLKDDDPIYPCNWVDRPAKRRCYRSIAYRVLGSVGWDFERAAERCASVERGFAGDCFRSLGKDASNHGGREPAPTLEKCALARRFGGEGDCVYGAAQDVTANFADGGRALPLCEQAAARFAETCFEGLGSVAGRFFATPQERRADCRALTSRDRLVEACLRGGRSALPRA